MKKKENVYEKSPWNNIDDYFNFAVKHNVYGLDAKKLWERIHRQVIPIPKIKNGMLPISKPVAKYVEKNEY